MSMKHGLLRVLATLAALCAADARASEGVTQISLASVQGGFPFVITAAGSYRLVGNLSVPNANTTAISIQAGLDGVEIDLNGFLIVGPNRCTYTTSTDTISCTGNGTGIGINGISATGVTVRNGFVRGMGSHGIYLGARSRVERVTSVDNGANGIETGARSTVTESRASRNQTHGIYMSDTATATGNVVSQVGSHGLQVASTRAVVEGNVVSETASIGLRTASIASVTSNVVWDASTGVQVNDASTVARNVVMGCRAAGMVISEWNTLRENVVYDTLSGGIGVVGIITGNDNLLVRNAIAGVFSGGPVSIAGGSTATITDNLTDQVFSVDSVSLGGNCCTDGSEFPNASGVCTTIPD